MLRLRRNLRRHADELLLRLLMSTDPAYPILGRSLDCQQGAPAPQPVMPATVESTTPEKPLEKRTWHYLRQPSHFEMAPCSCGNAETQWSEFAKHLWCAKCEKDFIPEHDGLFSGPILANVDTLLGIDFDRFNIETGQAERWDDEKLDWFPEQPQEKPNT